MPMSDNVFTYFIKIILLIAFINFALLIALPFLAEYISGDKILNDSIRPSKKEFFWEKSFAPSDDSGTPKRAGVQQTIDFFSFTPKVSGIYHIKIHNADFETDVKIVSGMIIPSEQPSYLPLLLISLKVTFVGLLSSSIRTGFRAFHLVEQSI